MSAVTVDGLLELEARAGASDQDREAWLAERRKGITATEVRDLYLGKITIPQLVALKLGRTTDTFSGNDFTRWGKERETVIADEVWRRYLIRPESRVFRAADDPRKLASPDGLGLDFDGLPVVSEIKTAGKDIAIGSPAFVEKGYFIQMVWVMRVIGAQRCLYAHEFRLDGPDGFEPGQLRFQWVEWSDAAVVLRGKLERIADDFLAALDRAAAGEDVAVIDEELDTLAVNYLRGLDLEKQAKELKEPSFRAMFELLDAGEKVVQESALARVSFTPAEYEERPVTVVDVDAARAAAPELYARYDLALQEQEAAAQAVATEMDALRAHEAKFVRESGAERVLVKKASLRVTAAKGTKETKA